MKGDQLEAANSSKSTASTLRVLQEQVEHRIVVTTIQSSSSTLPVNVRTAQAQPQSIHPVQNLRRRRTAGSSSPPTSATNSRRRKPMALQIPTPILEEPPDPLQHQQYLEDVHAQSAPPAARQHAGHVPQASSRAAYLPAQVFNHFKDVVEAQDRGDIEAVSRFRLVLRSSAYSLFLLYSPSDTKACFKQASAAFKAINAKLSKLPRDSPEKAEIFAECGLHLLLEARRCSAQHFANDAHTKAQRAKDCLQTAIKCE
jgi:hypothetical protein